MRFPVPDIFPAVPIALTLKGSARSAAEKGAARSDPGVPDLVLDQVHIHAPMTLTARAHPPSAAAMRTAVHRAAYAAAVVARYAADAAAAEPVPPTPDEDLADHAAALAAKAEVESRLQDARLTAAIRNRRGDPRPQVDAVKEIEKELDLVDGWVRSAAAAIDRTAADQRRYDDRRSRHWSRLSAAERPKVEARFAALRAKVSDFLQEACVEMVELFYLRDRLRWSHVTPCDPADMPAGYVAPGSEPDPEPEPAGEVVGEHEHEPAPASEHATADAGEHDPEDAGDEPANGPEAEPDPEPGSPAADARRAKVLALHAAGKSGRAIAKELGLHQTQVQRILKAAEPAPVVQTATPVHRGDTGPTKWVRAAEAPELS